MELQNQRRVEKNPFQLTDCHCHIAAKEYQPLSSFISKWKASGVGAVLAAGTDSKSNLAVLRLADKFPQFIYPTLGLHPERRDITIAEVEWTVKLIRDNAPKIAGLGEIGLPFYNLTSSSQLDRGSKLLEKLLPLAVELNLPVVLHAPHKTAPMALNLLREMTLKRALFHWHKSDKAVTKSIIEAGYFISITPEVCYRERDRALAKIVPPDCLLLESDGPWPYEGEFRNRLTEPTFLFRVAEEVARLKSISIESLLYSIQNNVKRLFNIPT